MVFRKSRDLLNFLTEFNLQIPNAFPQSSNFYNPNPCMRGWEWKGSRSSTKKSCETNEHKKIWCVGKHGENGMANMEWGSWLSCLLTLCTLTLFLGTFSFARSFPYSCSCSSFCLTCLMSTPGYTLNISTTRLIMFLSLFIDILPPYSAPCPLTCYPFYLFYFLP